MFPPESLLTDWQDHVVYNSFNGIVLASDEGRAIASALGSKKAAILQNHGILTVGATIEAALFWFLSLEKCCHTQLLVDAAAASSGQGDEKRVPRVVDDEAAAFTYATVGSAIGGYFSAKPLFDLLHVECSGAYLA